MNPVLLDILIHGLDSWLRSQPEPTTAAYPTASRSLLQEQSTLGWRQLFNGRCSARWGILQDRYLLHHFETIPDQLGSIKWTTLMIATTWQSVRTLWDLRNGQVYGLDSSSRSQKQKEQAHRKLCALYILQSNM